MKILLLIPALLAIARAETVTFNKDIAPVLFENCSSCHRPGEIGPFSLLTYADTKKRARQIARVTEQKIMPPWKPVAGHGEFRDPRVLTTGQIALFRKWLDAGRPEGDPADLPPMPDFPEGWHAGEPDLILKVAKPFTIPAEGPDIYVHFVLPLELTEDRYVVAAQVRPTDRSVAHHGVIMLDGSGKARKLAAEHGGDHYSNFGGPGFAPRGFLPGYAPGMVTRLDKNKNHDVCMTLPEGMDVVLQMHYHPTGKETTDQPQIGIYFTDKKPARNPAIVLMGNNDIDIPAGEKNYSRVDTFKLPVDFEVRDIWGHMHMIGKKIGVKATLPTGEKKDLLLIDDWDFNWQDSYIYKQPFVLPRGTVIRTEWTWDNTADNPRNPNHPPARVVLGEQSTDEMTGLIIGGITRNPGWEEGVHWLKVLAHYFEIEKAAKEAEKRRK